MREAAIVVAAIVGLGLAPVGCSEPSEDLTASEREKRIEAVRVLGREDDPESVDQLTEAVSHPDEITATEAVRAIGRSRSRSATETLARIARQEDRPRVRLEATVQLGQREDPQAAEALRWVVKNDDRPSVRGAAAAGLAQVGGVRDILMLVETAEREESVIAESQAVGAAERLLGIRFGYNSRAPREERKKVIARVRRLLERGGH